MASPNTGQRFNILWWVIAVLWFGGWHLWHTWAVWLHPLSRVPGPVGDNMVMLWNLGWVKHALSTGSAGFWFTNAYYPDGFLFLYGTHTWLDGVLGWAMSPLLPVGYKGSILWANITMLIATLTSGLLVISALKAWGVKQWPVLLLVASSVVFSWFRMFALTGHYHFYGTHWMLASLTLASYARLYLRSGAIRRSRWFFCLAGCAMGLAFLNDQTMAVFAGILCGIVICTAGNGTLPNPLLHILKTAASCYGFALLFAGVHLVPLLRALSTGSVNPINTQSTRLVDASSLVFPPDMHSAAWMVDSFREANGLFWAEGTYLGLVPMALFTLGAFVSVRYIATLKQNDSHPVRPIFWATACAGIFIVLSMGDTLVIGRQSYAALPGRLLKWIPVLNEIRLPQRWIWPAHLCIAISGALSLQFLTSKKFGRSIYWAMVALAAVPPLEGRSIPAVPPVDFRNDSFVNPKPLVKAVSTAYVSGGVLLMPVNAAYAHGNIFQFLWGYDIPLTISYTARMPFLPKDVPWAGGQWTPKAGEWLHKKQVSIVVFPFHNGDLAEFQWWLREARSANPALKIFNSSGVER